MTILHVHVIHVLKLPTYFETSKTLTKSLVIAQDPSGHVNVDEIISAKTDNWEANRLREIIYVY